jgi:ParB family transcriptional regulator, chromosome partitioning protein
MTDIDAAHSKLREIPVDLIDRNPENPRIFFRGKELEELTKSIRRYGVQVPISVYPEGGRYVLIDGERRWRCSVKLNRPKIPALVQAKPTTLTNLLLMFNIHALREQWDLLTMAAKLPKVMELLRNELKREPTETELSDRTGLSRSNIRRAKLLIDLPPHHIDALLAELKKPKTEQRLTEDFYIEMERALTTVSRAMPKAVPDRERTRQILIEKYKKGVFNNRTDFRYLAKIARAEKVEGDPKRARVALEKVFAANQYSPEHAFTDSVSSAYSERDLRTRIRGLIERLTTITATELDDIWEELEELRELLEKTLGRRS